MKKKSNYLLQNRWHILGFIIIAGLLLANLFYTIKIVHQNDIPVSANLGNLNIKDLSNDDLVDARIYLQFKQIKADLIPSGVPEIYGDELNISFDAVQDAINKVALFGPTYGQEGIKIILTGADLERYINIGSQISCQYCCGVKTLTKKDGTAACGCAHSVMMRGLAAYLIQNHPEFSDEQILKELNRWKISYFPKQTLLVKLAAMEKAGEPGIKELLQEFPDFLPQMVGGC